MEDTFYKIRSAQEELFRSLKPLEEAKLSKLLNGNKNMPQEYRYLIEDESTFVIAVKSRRLHDLMFYLGLEHITDNISSLFTQIDSEDEYRGLWFVVELYFDEDENHMIKDAIYLGEDEWGY